MTKDEIVAAYLLDRADQYETDSACWVALADAAGNILAGEHLKSHREGEFDDSLRMRVQGMKKRRQIASVHANSGVDPEDEPDTANH